MQSRHFPRVYHHHHFIIIIIIIIINIIIIIIIIIIPYNSLYNTSAMEIKKRYTKIKRYKKNNSFPLLKACCYGALFFVTSVTVFCLLCINTSSLHVFMAVFKLL